jgi:hypothetical protein
MCVTIWLRPPDADEKRVPMTVFFGSVFVMDVDSKATFAFEAKNFPEAFELCKEGWVREDLITMTSNGVPLCSSTAKLTVRRADEAEIVIYRNAAIQAQTEDLVLAYLVDLDRA